MLSPNFFLLWFELSKKVNAAKMVFFTVPNLRVCIIDFTGVTLHKLKCTFSTPFRPDFIKVIERFSLLVFFFAI